LESLGEGLEFGVEDCFLELGVGEAGEVLELVVVVSEGGFVVFA
jgi:hypothetical protein